RSRGSSLPQRARMLNQKLDECLTAIPPIDAPTQIRIKRDRALDESHRHTRMLEPTRAQQRASNLDPFISAFLVAALEERANAIVVAERGENEQCRRQGLFSREQVQQSRRAGVDHVLPGLPLDD